MSSILETPRFRLQPHTLADFPECRDMWADPAVTRFVGGRPSTAEEVWARLLRYAGLWQLLGYGYFTVRERETGRFAGEVGVADFHRDMTPSLGDAPEMGWILASWCHGRGAATEAVRAAACWCDGQGIARTVCLIDPDNQPSRRVAEKTGYVEYARTTYKDKPIILLERPTRTAS